MPVVSIDAQRCHRCGTLAAWCRETPMGWLCMDCQAGEFRSPAYIIPTVTMGGEVYQWMVRRGRRCPNCANGGTCEVVESTQPGWDVHDVVRRPNCSTGSKTSGG